MTTPLVMADRVRTSAAMGESHFREFKTGLEGEPGAKRARPVDRVRREVAEALVAFANADGGELLVGVEDDGTITGLPHSAERLDAILRAPEELVHADTPLSGVTRATVVVDEQAVLYFAVGKSMSFVHQTSDGRCVRRRDLETIPAVAAVVKVEREEESSREYDRDYVDGATLADLDLDLVGKSAGVISPGSTPEMLLQQLNLADFADGALRLRRAALLLFALEIERWHPRSAVRVLRVDGTDLLTGAAYNVVYDSTATGPVVALIADAWDLLRPHLSRTALTDRARFEETVLFPEDACLEALVNAIAHRNYAAEGRLVEVFLYSDRVEITSPGRLLKTVSLESLQSGGGVHESRNTLLSRVLRELGFMREMGEGIRRMFTLMREHDLVDPSFSETSDSFTAILANRSSYPPEALKWIEGYRPFKLTREEQRVVLMCATGKPVSPAEVAAGLGLTDMDDYRVIFTELQAKGLAHATMSKRQVQARARHLRKQPRDVARILVRTPTEALGHYEDLLGALRASAAAFPLTRSSVGDVRIRLSPDSPFGGSDGGLMTSLRALELIDPSGDPTPTLMADFRSYGIDLDLAGDGAESGSTDQLERGDARIVFDELFGAAASLGVELTLQTAGNRMRGRLGAEAYQSLVAGGGLRTFVEGLGNYEVVDDHGRHVVRLRG